jgi:hypothetical protein
MFKKFILFFALLAILATPSFAVEGIRINGVPYGAAIDINNQTGSIYTLDGSTYTETNSPVSSNIVTNSTATLTLTAANLKNQSIFQETGSTAATFTLDTGTNLSNLFAGNFSIVGTVFCFVVSNASTQTVTLSGATGTTLSYAMTVPTLTTKIVFLVNTGTNTWTAY